MSKPRLTVGLLVLVLVIIAFLTSAVYFWSPRIYAQMMLLALVLSVVGMFWYATRKGTTSPERLFATITGVGAFILALALTRLVWYPSWLLIAGGSLIVIGAWGLQSRLRRHV